MNVVIKPCPTAIAGYMKSVANAAPSTHGQATLPRKSLIACRSNFTGLRRNSSKAVTAAATSANPYTSRDETGELANPYNDAATITAAMPRCGVRISEYEGSLRADAKTYGSPT